MSAQTFTAYVTTVGDDPVTNKPRVELHGIDVLGSAVLQLPERVVEDFARHLYKNVKISISVELDE